MSLKFFEIENELAPEKGKLLLSEPLSNDDYFGRSVVLLTEHSDAEGTVGFILNKESNYVLSDLISDIDSNFKIYTGGPVQPNSLHYIHAFKSIKNTVRINDKVYWGGDFEQIKEWITTGIIKENQIQFFMGYSGWASQQLNQELDRKLWVVAEIQDEEISFNQQESFWRKKLKTMDDKYKIWLNVPENPSLN